MTTLNSHIEPEHLNVILGISSISIKIWLYLEKPSIKDSNLMLVVASMSMSTLGMTYISLGVAVFRF